MSSRLRPLLPACALAAIVVAVAVAIPIAALAAGSSGSTSTATVDGRAKPKRPARRHVKPAPTLGERAAKLALRAVGVPYRWGGTSMSGFDCSGLVYWAYRRLGVSVPHNSYALWSSGRSVPRSRLRPGDVLVFNGLGHVGLYVGRGRMVHAPYSGRDVEIVRLSRSSYGRRLAGARRFVRS